MMGPLDHYIIKEDALNTEKQGASLKFQSHWYRSLPLSCMEFDVLLDGVNIDPGQIEVKVNRKIIPYQKMKDLYQEWLFIKDQATAYLHLENPLKKGKEYDVILNLRLYIPYVLVGGAGNPLMVSSTVHQSLICH